MLCANSRLTGCSDYVKSKGNIFCDTCNETRKNNTKNKREQDFDELLKKISETEKENMRLRQQIFEVKINYDKEIKSLIESVEKKNNEQEQKINELLQKEKELEHINAELDKINKDMEFLNFKEKSDNFKLDTQVQNLQKEIYIVKNNLLDSQKDRDRYKYLYEQIQIDYEKLQIERKERPRFESNEIRNEIRNEIPNNINSIPTPITNSTNISRPESRLDSKIESRLESRIESKVDLIQEPLLSPRSKIPKLSFLKL
jgi:hypothetical protein